MANIFDLIVRIAGDGGNLRRDIDEDKAKLDELTLSAHDRDMNIKVDVDDAVAKQKLDDLAAKERFMQSGGGEGGGGLLLGSILSALPLLSPLSATLLGAVGALGGAFTSAGAGATAFGAVAIPTIKDALKATKDLTAEQKQVQTEVKGIKTQFESIQQGATPQVLQVFSGAVRILREGLAAAPSLISAAGNGFLDLEKSLQGFMTSGGFTKLVQFLTSNAKDAIVAFGKSAGNVFLGLMNLFQAFGPLIKPIENGLVNMTASFVKWSAGLSSSSGFQKFLSYISQEGPVVLSVIGSLVRIIINLLVAMAPAGAVMLGFIANVLKWVAAFTEAHPVIKGVAAGLLQFIGLLKLIGPLFTAIGGPWGILISAIITGVTLIVTHWQQIRNAAQTLGSDLRTVWGGIVDWFNGLLQRIVSFFSTWGPSILSVIAPFIGIPLQIITHWQSIVEGLSEIWNTIKSAAKDFVNTIVDSFKWMYNHNYYFKDLVDFISKAWKTIQSDASTAWNDIKSWLSNLWNGLKSTAQSIWTSMASVGKTIWNGFKSTLDGIWSSIRSAASSAWNGIKSSIGSVAKSAVSELESVFRGLGNFFSGLWSEATQWGSNLVHHVAQGITNAIGAVRSAVSNVAGAIGNFLGFHSPTKEGAGSEADVWMPNLMNMMTDGIKAGTPKLKAALNDALSIPQYLVSPNVANMISMGNGTLKVQYSGSIQHEHTGTVDWGKPSKQSINYLEQQIYKNGISRGLR